MAPAPPPPPPPPPPFCVPFRSKKPKRVTTLAASEKGSNTGSIPSSILPSSRKGSRTTFNSSSTATLPNRISEDSESYDVVTWGAGKKKGPPGVMAREFSSGSSSSADPPGGQTGSSISRQSSSRSNGSRSTTRPGIHGNDSSSTLVGSALERKINDVESVKEKPDTGPRLTDLRSQMKKVNIHY